MNLDLLPKRGFIKLPLLAHILGITESGIVQRIAKDKFPAPIKFGYSRVWKVEDVRKALGIPEDEIIENLSIQEESKKVIPQFLNTETLEKCVDEIIVDHPIFNRDIFLKHILKKNLFVITSKRKRYAEETVKNLLRRLRVSGYIEMLTVNSGSVCATYEKAKIRVSKKLKVRRGRKLQYSSFDKIICDEVMRIAHKKKEFISNDIFLSLKDTIGKKYKSYDSFTSTIRNCLRKLKIQGKLLYNNLEYPTAKKVWKLKK